MPIRLSEKDFQKLVDKALATLPDEFLPYMENVSVEVQPRATPQMLREAGVEPGGELLGYYVGVPLPEKSVSAPWDLPERILIFQKPIEEICRSRQEVVEEVRLTVLHEIGHHFGMDEEDLEGYGY
jgi:predicted Zn-dependent protease with MMP-like domain